jgi:hypothetical protein
MMLDRLRCDAAGHSYPTMRKQTVVSRFLGLDGYEWFVTITGTVLIGLAAWLM